MGIHFTVDAKSQTAFEASWSKFCFRERTLPAMQMSLIIIIINIKDFSNNINWALTPPSTRYTLTVFNWKKKIATQILKWTKKLSRCFECSTRNDMDYDFFSYSTIRCWKLVTMEITSIHWNVNEIYPVECNWLSPLNKPDLHLFVNSIQHSWLPMLCVTLNF